MNTHLLTLLLSDENVLALFFGGAYLLLGLLYVVIIGLLVALYAGAKNTRGIKGALCLLAVSSGFYAFMLGAGLAYDLPDVVVLFIWFGFPLLVIILALAKSSKSSQPASHI